LDRGKEVLFEGAQGTLLDVDHGTYPYVTSSNSTAGGACTGTGVGPKKIDKVIGVAKAYTTRVGRGPFPTEMEGRIGEKIRKIGNEFGVTTGRPRRCGWLDLVILRYAKIVNGLDEIAITKLDVLSGLEKIKICTSYEIEGKKENTFPTNSRILEKANPVFETFDGWKMNSDDWKKAVKRGRIPKKAQKYLDKISDEIDIPICLVSVGPEREMTVGIGNS
jgi:adenylosuccinate synthase